MPKKLFQVVYAMNYISQVAFCLLCPAGLFIGLAWFLTSRGYLGSWAMAAGIILGVLTGFWSMISFLLKSAKAIDPTEKEDSHGAK